MKNRHFLYFIILISTISCKNKSTNNRVALQNQIVNNSQITLILNKRNYKGDTLFLNKGGYMVRKNPMLSYISDYPYDDIDITPKNIKTSDTIIIKSNSKIILSHRYNFYYTSDYIFNPGDTVVFCYTDDGIPLCSINNRSVSKMSLNFEANYNMDNTVFEEDGVFYDKNGSFRTKKEKNEYKDNLKINLRHQILALDSLNDNKEFSTETYPYLKDKINYTIANLSFPDYNLKESDLKNDTLLKVASFRHFISYYVNRKFKVKLLKQGNRATLNNKAAFDSINNSNIFSDKIKCYLLYNNLKKIAQNFSVEDSNNYLKKFKESVNDSVLINEIKNTYLLGFSEINRETKAVYFINKKKEKLKFSGIIEANKGKLIYIDFWASWCAPCRSAIPASRKLKTEFKNREVVFIYVSIDKNLKAWKKASEDEGLSFYKNNILAVNYPNANFYKELDLKTIPRYILYDKKGKLIHQNAPGPEGEEIRKLFDKYLEE